MTKLSNKLFFVLAVGLLALVVIVAAGCESPIGGPQPLNETELEESEVGQFPPTDESQAGKSEQGSEQEGETPADGQAGHGGEAQEEGGHEAAPTKSRKDVRIEELLAKSRGVPLEELEEDNPLKPTAANIEAGRALYEGHCTSCHGLGGYGDGEAARGMNPPPADLHEDYVQLQSDGALFYLVSRGLPGSKMPGYGKKLNEHELWQVITYVRTFSELAPPPLVE